MIALLITLSDTVHQPLPLLWSPAPFGQPQRQPRSSSPFGMPVSRWCATCMSGMLNLDHSHQHLILQPTYCPTYFLCPLFPSLYYLGRLVFHGLIRRCAFFCLYPRAMDFRGYWNMIHPYNAAVKKHHGNPSYFQAFASILSSAEEETSPSFKSHISTRWSEKTAPCISQANGWCWRISRCVRHRRFHISLSEKIKVYYQPRLQIGWLERRGISHSHVTLSVNGTKRE